MKSIRRVNCIQAYPMAPVLLIGETGTGKDLVTQTIHKGSGLPPENFIKCDIPASLIKGDLQPLKILSEIFHSPPPATNARVEEYKRHHRRTIMIDGVDQLTLVQQAQLVDMLSFPDQNDSVGDM